ncbi:hypothetical protein CHS0354_023951 [Potamilus streckersoni]|uniref:Uncharacterized protein n=1 Tax=Potamilus streckersoni TaxID=2493646 RepID=A0AAE0VLW7_9BIVA|nr:hypothetical protein CHS0354_023951 [Potamilus streckersoni]
MGYGVWHGMCEGKFGNGEYEDPVPVPGITVYLYKKGDYSASTTLAIASLKLNSIDKQDSNNKGECSFTIKESGEYVIEAYYKIGAIGTEKRKSAEVGAAPGADPVTKTVELLLD